MLYAYPFELLKAIKHLRSLNNAVLFSRIRHGRYSLLSYEKMQALEQLGTQVRSLNGDVVECGSYNGGSAAILARSSDKKIWLFDSFEGMPKPTPEDGEQVADRYYVGWAKGSEERVHEVFRSLGLRSDSYFINKGWFQETFPKVSVARIALLHIDADWYESVSLSLHKFYDAVVPNGYIVFDDYGHWEGCRTAVDEFLEKRNLNTRLTLLADDAYYLRKDHKGDI